MRKYKNGKKLLQVICNQCNKEMKVENGYLKEGCFQADYVFGYFSKKYGMRHRFDLCENYYEKMLEKFSIPVEEVREKELL